MPDFSQKATSQEDTEPSQPERRQSVRYPVPGRARLELGGGAPSIEMRLADISQGGVSCRSDRSVPMGARCVLHLEIPIRDSVERFTCTAKVQRCILKGRHHEVGLQFLVFEGDGQTALARVYAERSRMMREG